MKIKSLTIENTKSFLQKQTLNFNQEITIIIGPNGGGKTNLLDITNLVIRKYLILSWTIVPNGHGLINVTQNDSLNSQNLIKHYQGISLPQNIIIEFYLGQNDINNLNIILQRSDILLSDSKRVYQNILDKSFFDYDINQFKVNDVFKFSIKDGRIEVPIDNISKTILQYLNKYDIIFHILTENKINDLTFPILNLPIGRSSSELNTSISLANFNEFDLKRVMDASHSKNFERQGSIFLYSLGRLVKMYRKLLELDNGNARRLFYEEPNIKAFTNTLEKLGYKWKLNCVNTDTNQYEIELEKQGIKFNVGNASSGEREILTYLFAIYFLNVKNTLIIIDEPELHLHPKWQQNLMSIFENLVSETGNQFLIATHSTVFVSPKTIKYITRVYSENQESIIHQIDESNLPDSKHLIKIVNSNNNEKIFFADFVVLVEGITDKIVFEKFLNNIANNRINFIFEIIDVGGKMMFENYKRLLDACQIKYAIIADFDYLKEVGSEDIKNIISKSSQSNVIKNVLNDSSSIDAENLYNLIENAIINNDTSELSNNWEYIKNRQTSVRGLLTDDEFITVSNFIINLYSLNLYVLKQGNLEKYLIPGYKSKDVNKIIDLVSKPDFENYFESETITEIKEITKKILNL